MQDIRASRSGEFLGHLSLLPAASAAAAMVATPCSQHRVRAEIGIIQALHISTDGRFIAAHGPTTAIVWDTSSRARLARFTFDAGIASMSLHGTGDTLLVADSAGLLYVLDVESGTTRGTLATLLCFPRIHGAAAASMVAMSADTGVVLVFDYLKGSLVREFAFPPPAPLVFMSADGLLLSTDSPQQIALWDVASGDLLREFSRDAYPSELTARPGSGCVIGARVGTDLVIWDAVEGHCLKRHPCPAPHNLEDEPDNIEITPDARYLAARSGSSVHVWDLQQRARSAVIKTYTAPLTSVRLAPDGERVFLAGDDATVPCYSKSGRNLYCLIDQTRPIVAVCCDAEDRVVAVADQDGGLTVYDTLDGTHRRFRHHQGSVSSVHMRGTWIATVGHDGTLKVTDLGDGAVIADFTLPVGPVQAVRLTADGRVFVGAGDGALRCYDVVTRRCLAEYRGHSSSIRSISLSKDGCWISSTDEDGLVIVHDAASRGVGMRLALAGVIYAARFDGVGDQLILGTEGGELRSVDRATARSTVLHSGHTSHVRGLTVTRERIASIGLYGDVCVYDRHTESIAYKFQIPDSRRQRAIRYNLDATRFLTAGADGCVRFHDSSDGREIAVLHHLDTGHLWMASADTAAEPGWFWTDRPELIEVQPVSGTGEPCLPCAPARQEHLRVYNNRGATMSRVGWCMQTRTVTARAPAPEVMQFLECQRRVGLLPQ